jgi:hypothetical protein
LELCCGPPWISARLRSHYRPGLKWAIWVTSFRMRREDRSSISSHPLADLGGKRDMLFHHRLLLRSSSSVRAMRPFLCPGLPLISRRRAQGPSSLAVALTSPLARRFQARLDGTEHGATLKQVGAPFRPVPASYAGGAGARPDHSISGGRQTTFVAPRNCYSITSAARTSSPVGGIVHARERRPCMHQEVPVLAQISSLHSIMSRLVSRK